MGKRRQYGLGCAAVVCWISLGGICACAQEQVQAEEGRLTVVRELTADELEGLHAPEEEYTGENGQVYRLKSWDIREQAGEIHTEYLRRRVYYEDVEGEETLPQEIEPQEQRNGIDLEGNLSLTEVQAEAERWDPGFSLPVTFHSYGAEGYVLGDAVIPDQDVLQEATASGGLILEQLGLSEGEYRITGMEWAGPEYTDPEGNLCRQAQAYGEKLLRDYRAVYEGEVQWKEPYLYELRAVYELPLEGAAPTPEEAAPEAVPERERESIWYRIRRMAALTVGLGLIGIGLGGLILLALSIREKRRRNEKPCLPDSIL